MMWPFPHEPFMKATSLSSGGTWPWCRPSPCPPPSSRMDLLTSKWAHTWFDDPSWGFSEDSVHPGGKGTSKFKCLNSNDIIYIEWTVSLKVKGCFLWYFNDEFGLIAHLTFVFLWTHKIFTFFLSLYCLYTSCILYFHMVMMIHICFQFYEYGRSGNPTRDCLEKCLSSIENAKFGELIIYIGKLGLVFTKQVS